MRRGTFFHTFPATSILLLLNLSFFALEGYYTHQAQPHERLIDSLMGINSEVALSLGTNYLPRVEMGEIWRLISCAFLHFGLVHIGLNAWVLSDLGRLCEPMLGTERFTVVYVASAIGGSLGSMLFALATHQAVSSAGASGALMGLIGLLLGFSLRHRDRQLRDDLLRWIVYIIIMSFFMGQIDHAGHAGGFITGACFGYFTPRYVSSQGARAFRIPFYLSVVVTAVSLGWALWNFFGR